MEHRQLASRGRALRGGTPLIGRRGGPAALLLAGLLLFVSWPARAQQPGDLILAVTSSNRLISVRSTAPATVVASVPISSADPIVAVDVRPATGQLFGLTSAGRLVLIDPETGRTIAIRSARVLDPSGGVAIDFDPISDTLLIVDRLGSAIAIDPATTTVLASQTLSTTVSGVAFADDGRCYLIGGDRLAIVTATGAQRIASIDVAGAAGFDIAPGGTAYTIVDGGLAELALDSGKATPLGAFSTPVVAIAVARAGQPTVPAALPATATPTATGTRTPTPEPPFSPPDPALAPPSPTIAPSATATAPVATTTTPAVPNGPTATSVAASPTAAPSAPPAAPTPTTTPPIGAEPTATLVPGLPGLPDPTPFPTATPTTVFPRDLPVVLRRF